ncbi:DUF3078 domain-containing protein [Haoranjiania flava]|uniref:DUF3078 domain-containing protein n=1 Tax=Haoranjiania flava TaxID=1856322 RepID=A0AAE3INA4_9BACT|nr:DUF3078 domain-containing protein [Haoranjiania flava]MCU7693451.1 DUF3078 domain-containing protein [Haoranjiania flava]
MNFLRYFIFILVVFSSLPATYAQRRDEIKTLPSEIFKKVRKDSRDTVDWKWKYGGNNNINLGQTSLRNWAGGGEKFTLTISSFQNAFIYYRKDKHTWDNNVDMNFGYIQTTSQGARKNDDRFNFTSKYGLQADSSKKLFFSALYDLRTQLFDGRKYFKKDSSELTSTFFSPSYQLFSLGMDYKPNEHLSVFVSPITSRFTAVPNREIAIKGLYLEKGMRFKASPGAFASINYAKNNIIKNVNYRSRLDMFSDYTNHPENVDILMNNLLTFRINKFISATYSLDLIYDDDIRVFGPEEKSPALQVKSLIGIGFSLPYKNGYVAQKKG